MATSGGAPPATAVLRTVGRLSPLDWYWALTPVLDEKPSRTFWKSACSVDAHLAQTVTLPPMFWPPPLLLALLVPPPPPPHAATEAINATPKPNRRVRLPKLIASSSPCSATPPRGLA